MHGTTVKEKEGKEKKRKKRKNLRYYWYKMDTNFYKPQIHPHIDSMLEDSNICSGLFPFSDSKNINMRSEILTVM